MHQPAPVETQALRIDDIRRRHEGEWLLVKILDTGVPLGEAPGEVLAQGTDRMAMFKAERKVRKKDPTAALAIVAGGDKFGDGDVLRRELARIAAEEEFVSVNPW